VLQTIQVSSDTSDIGVIDTRRCALDAWVDHRLETLFELDANRVVEASEISSGVLDATV
jgi:hypothetical protein